VVSPVQHPVALNQAENIFIPSSSHAAAKAAQKPPAKPQPVQDSVKLSRTK